MSLLAAAAVPGAGSASTIQIILACLLSGGFVTGIATLLSIRSKNKNVDASTDKTFAEGADILVRGSTGLVVVQADIIKGLERRLKEHDRLLERVEGLEEDKRVRDERIEEKDRQLREKDRKIAELEERVADLERQIREFVQTPGPPGERGPQGDRGERGQDLT